MTEQEKARATAPFTLRPAVEEDREFLYSLYATTRDYEMVHVPWTDEMKAAFLRQQAEAQYIHYSRHYGDARHDIICVDGVPSGRIMVSKWADQLHIVDLCLMREARRTGIGRELVERLQAEATAAGLPLKGHVEFMNPACRFWAAMGFEIVQTDGIYHEIRWWPAGF